MKRIIELVLLCLMALPAWATTYYLSPTGSDTGDGLSVGAAWLSPNHALNCGDVILAQPGNYNSANFYNQKWGVVNCPSKNDVAWLKCATFDTCKISTATQHGMFVSGSFWGVQGWEITTTSTSTTQGGHCIAIAPDYGRNQQIDHIILANNIANGCNNDGFDTNNGWGTTPTVGVDYVAYIGNIVYDTGHNFCAAGLSFYSPVPSDTAPGTHLFMAGNFGWNNHSTCGDGEGIILDVIDGVEAGWPTAHPYNQQIYIANNWMGWNDGPGLQLDLNMNGTPASFAPVYIKNNTFANNGVGPSSSAYCSQLVLGTTVNAQATGNLSATYQQYCFGGSSIPSYAEAAVWAGSASNRIYNDYAYSSFGNHIGSISSAGFVAGPSIVSSADPAFPNPARPGAPSCGAFTTTTACMATLIANFTPTNPTAKQYGFKAPSSTPVFDPLFPQWLCTVSNIPSGLITMGCNRGSLLQ